MKRGIAFRIFLSILAATFLAVLSFFLVMQWSINRGFFQYLSTLDQANLEQFSGRLEQAYAGHGSWDFLRGRSRGWIIRFLASPEDEAGAERLREPDRNGERAPLSSAPAGRVRPRQRLIILDQDRNPLLGNVPDSNLQEVSFRPLSYQGQTVGYIGFLPPRHFLAPQQLRFLRQQKLALAVAAGVIVLVVVLFSLPLAERMVRPIKAMVAATHDIAAGNYATRVEISSTDELGRLARDFNAMAQTLESHEKERRQWLADISHELRTPLAVLRGEIEALLDGIRPVSAETVRSLHAEVLRLHGLVDDIYQLALSDIGALEYRKENLDLAEVLGESLERYRPEFVRKGIAVRSETGPQPGVVVYADRERLTQLFANLFDNSLKYTDAGGELVVRAECAAGRAIVEFRDSAPGVPEKDLARLFDRLYRVDGSRSRASGGAGLGLAICKEIVEAHDGTISAHPSPAGGVIIRIGMPAAGPCP